MTNFYAIDLEVCTAPDIVTAYRFCQQRESVAPEEAYEIFEDIDRGRFDFSAPTIVPDDFAPNRSFSPDELKAALEALRLRYRNQSDRWYAPYPCFADADLLAFVDAAPSWDSWQVPDILEYLQSKYDVSDDEFESGDELCDILRAKIREED